MTDIPIIFSAPMVRALLDGQKTMTRRLAYREVPHKDMPEHWHMIPTPWQRAKIGDRLWVREKLQYFGEPGGIASLMHDPLHWAADERQPGIVGPAIPTPEDWRLPKRSGEYIPSIHMPRWASRLTLIVTGAKIERLQDLSEADAIAEGVHRIGHDMPWAAESFKDGPNFYSIDMDSGSLNQPTAAGTFALLWKCLHGEGSWESNPEVVALSFRVYQANVDAVKMDFAA